MPDDHLHHRPRHPVFGAVPAWFVSRPFRMLCLTIYTGMCLGAGGLLFHEFLWGIMPALALLLAGGVWGTLLFLLVGVYQILAAARRR